MPSLKGIPVFVFLSCSCGYDKGCFFPEQVGKVVYGIQQGRGGYRYAMAVAVFGQVLEGPGPEVFICHDAFCYTLPG